MRYSEVDDTLELPRGTVGSNLFETAAVYYTTEPKDISSLLVGK